MSRTNGVHPITNISDTKSRGLLGAAGDQAHEIAAVVAPLMELNILAVLNDVGEAEIAFNELERAGYTVRTDLAQSRNEFLVRMRASSYDIILATYPLRGWTALELLANQRELGIECPVILIAAEGDETAIKLVNAGAADYVTRQNMKRLPVAVGRAIAEIRAKQQSASADELIKKLTMAVNQSPASILFTDTRGRIEYVNRRFSEVTGFTFDEAVGKSPRLLSSGRNPRELYADMWKTIRAGDIWRGELQNRKKNGELYWDSVSISPIRDSNGAITHFLGCQEDVTEHKMAEQKIRDSEERFRQLAENLQEVFFVTSISLREMLYVSPAYEEIWGRSCQSLYDNPQSFIDPVVAEDREGLFAFVATLQKGDIPVPIEYRVLRPDGSIRWVLAHGAPIRDASGVVYRISGTALDVTDRRAAEEASQESATRFRLLTEASFDGIDIVVNGVVHEANQGLADMLGYTIEELIGSPVLDFVDEESHETVKLRIAEGFDGIYEFVARHKSGRKMTLEAAGKGHIINGQSGRITALRDVTEKRALENQFRQAQKMEAVGRLAGGVAHDFNNLLTVIMAYTEILSADLGPGDERREDLDEILKASKAAASLTRQLLAFSRQQVIEPRLVHLNEILGSSHKMLGRLIGEDIELVSNLSESSCPVVIDPGQFEQIIMNLAVNARDAMPTGGKLTLETAIVDLDEEYARNHLPAVAGRFAMVAISDSGIGMSAETKARLFEPFFTTKEVGKGTGLGLATVYGIVKQSNGFIWVYSEPGHGTTFKVYFPLADGEGKPEACHVETERLEGTETILLVEDSPPVRAAALRVLERLGYRMLEAPTAKAALAMAAKKQEQIDLLLTDVVMPEMSGRQVAEQFALFRPEAGVLFMSGYTDDAVVRHGILQAGVAYLQKPFTGESLASKVRAVLDARRGRATPGLD
jgi:two-component system cell cycle sensor histidine kinase/response regulator CckA